MSVFYLYNRAPLKILALKLDMTSAKVGYTEEDGRITVQEGAPVSLVILGT